MAKLRDIVIEPHGRKRTMYVLRSPRLNSLLEHLRTTEIGMVAVLRSFYAHFINIVRLTYLPILGELGNIVGEIDVIFTGAKLAIDNNYVKP